MEIPRPPAPPPPPGWQPAQPPAGWQPAATLPAGSGWAPSPPPGPPTRTGSPVDIAGVVTIVLSGIVALALLVTIDSPGDLITSERLWVPFSALAGFAAPLAVLVAWGEFDLSSIGMIGLGSYAYAEIANDDRTLLAAIAAIALCTVLGAVVGAMRFLTHAHSVLISIALGLLLQGVVLEVASLRGISVGGGINNLLLFVLALAIVAAATGLVTQSPTRTDTSGTMPEPLVIAAFALAGLGAGFYAVTMTSHNGFASPAQDIGGFVLLLGFAAVAVGGVGPGARMAAPPLAALGALVVTVISMSGVYHDWAGWRLIVIGAVFVVSVVIGGTIRRFVT